MPDSLGELGCPCCRWQREEPVPEDKEGISQSGVLQGCWNQCVQGHRHPSTTLTIHGAWGSLGSTLWQRNNKREEDSHTKGFAWSQLVLWWPCSLLSPCCLFLPFHCQFPSSTEGGKRARGDKEARLFCLAGGAVLELFGYCVLRAPLSSQCNRKRQGLNKHCPFHS